MNKSSERRYIMHKDFTPPVSIEEFAAYLDGNLSDSKMDDLQQLIDNDVHLRNIIDINSFMEDNISSIIDEEWQLPDEILKMDFEYPGLNESLENFVDEDDIFSQEDKSIYTEAVDYPFGDHHLVSEGSKDINYNNSEVMAGNILQGNIHYGEIGQNIKDPIFIQQPDDHSCALRSQQIILRDFGIDIPFNDLERIAKENGVYSDEGTVMYDVGKVLDIVGVGMHQVVGGNMFDLTNELAQGHRVIVGVDSNELWYNDTLAEKLKNRIDDITGPKGGNHALIVAGVAINPNDPNDVKVVLTDPGSGDLRIEYPMKQFMDAWKDTNCFMAATNDAAPYQYDPVTGMEVPSNFVVECALNQFVLDHSYQLSPDLINVPSDYQPAYSGHLDIVGDEPYDDFKIRYDEMLEQRNLLSSLQSSSDGDENDGGENGGNLVIIDIEVDPANGTDGDVDKEDDDDETDEDDEADDPEEDNEDVEINYYDLTDSEIDDDNSSDDI